MRIFGKERDFEAFEEVIEQAKARLPVSRRRPFMDGAALCGKKSTLGEHGPRCGCLAMVESLASKAWQQSRTLGRRADGVAASLAATR
jgi:hypothetical protein